MPRASAADRPSTDPGGPTTHWARWVLGKRFGSEVPQKWEPNPFHKHLRDSILVYAAPQQGETVLDVGTGDGLIGFGALEYVGESGRVIFSDISSELIEYCRKVAEARGVSEQCEFVVAAAEDLSTLGDATVDAVTTRSVLIYIADKERALSEFRRVLKPGGRLAMFEPINSFGQPAPPTEFWGFDLSAIPDIAGKLHQAHESCRLAPACAPMSDFDERDLLTMLERTGYTERVMQFNVQIINTPLLDSRSWDAFMTTAPNPLVPTFAEFVEEILTPGEREQLEHHLRPLVETGRGRRQAANAFFWARA